MRRMTCAVRTVTAIAAFVLTCSPMAFAEDTPQQPATPPRSSSRLGVQGAALVGLGLQLDAGSFDALGLSTRSLEAGAAVQVTNIWRSLFVQVSASRLRETGERAFVDSRGEVFPLGIPLRVEMTPIDVGVGWRFEGPGRAGRLVPYAGAGAGVVRYEESSPFAQPGEDVETSKPSYHVFGGVEVGLTRWLGIAGDVRYRAVPGLLGDDGVSSELGDNGLTGTSVSLRILIGPRGRAGRPRPAPPTWPPAREDSFPPLPKAEEQDQPRSPDASAAAPSPDAVPAPESLRDHRRAGIAIVNIDAGVFVAPDGRREPLRILRAGTQVQVMREEGDWLLVQFDDPRWGRRTGYIRKEHCDW